jgi:two-component system chemotaxis sensor kinase CheA
VDEIVREFLVESQENLNTLDHELVALERDPAAKSGLPKIFRIVHSMKGSAGFLGYRNLGNVAHVGENLLSLLRDGKLAPTSEIISALLALVDAIRAMLGAIEASGTDGASDYRELIERLHRLQSPGRVAPAQPGRGAPQTPPAAPEVTGFWPPSGTPPDQPASAAETIQLSRKPNPAPSTGPTKRPAASRRAKKAAPAEPAPQPSAPPGTTPPRSAARPGASAPPAASSLPPAVTQVAPEEQAGLAAEPHDSVAAPPQSGGSSRRIAAPAVADSTIRVDVALLDRLMSLMAELVLARNRLVQHTARSTDYELLSTTQRVNAITTELQEGMMKTRMQTIGGIWNKLPRLVRDLALECGRRAHVELEGGETELDRTVIEAIREPLTHLVRNAVDHGIEPPERRAVLGKPVEGTIKLKAFHESGQVNIEIKDDGAGIDPGRIRRKALERGLISQDEAAKASEREILNLIFLPGFSTAEELTLVSGRGVGMDVAKTGIEKIGGTIHVESKVGEGTAIKIKIPLTLAIIKALLVTTGDERYAVPQANLLELIRLSDRNGQAGVEFVDGAPVYRYRGKLLPVVDLGRVLENPRAAEAGRIARAGSIVVAQAEGQQFGMLVDEVSDVQEIVVRPLASQLSAVPCFAGATILGDGHIALILDVFGVAKQAGAVSDGRPRAHAQAETPEEPQSPRRQQLLLIDATDQTRMAVPLERVECLVKLARSSIQTAGGQMVANCRGQALDLVDPAATLAPSSRIGSSTTTRASEGVHVVVCRDHDQSAGLVCERVVDIVAAPEIPGGRAERAGVLHTAILQGQISRVLDIEAIFRASGLGSSG